MSKKSRHTSSKPAPVRRLPWLSLISGGVVLLIIIVCHLVDFVTGPATPSGAAPTGG
jgi:hypothetical protein